MNTTEAWHRTSPLAVLFFLGQILRALVKNAWQSLAPAAAFLFAYQGSVADKLGIAVGAFVVITVTVAILRYWFFRFLVTDDAILIRDGIFRKTQLDIKYERIQGIKTEQSFVYRWFGLVTVNFDTAGSSGNEGNLPAVPTLIANDLRRRIRGKADPVESDEVAAQDTGGDVLLKLGWADMVRIGLSDRRVLVVLAVLGPLFEQLDERGEAAIEAFVDHLGESLGGLDAATGALLVAGFIVAVILLLALLSIGAAFLRHHGFELSYESGALRTGGGLLTRHEATMDIVKVQRLVLSQGALLRLFGRWRAVLQQAGSGGQGQQDRNLLIPVLDPGFAKRLTEIAFDAEAAGLTVDPGDPGFRGISAFYMRPRILLFGVLPAVAITALVIGDAGPAAALFLLWIPVVALFVYLVWRRYGVLADADGLVRRSGLIGYRLDVLLFRKVQRVTVRQSWFQARRGLAELRVYLASGSVRIPYIPYEAAAALRDYILYKVESSDRSWH